jgi:hypothetical protein
LDRMNRIDRMKELIETKLLKALAHFLASSA